jgi:competence ComEA-like helix-hairpin-helix protein
MVSKVFKVCLPALCLTGFLSAAGFPQAEISNSDLHLKIYLPDSKAGFYRATRFDWSGMIGSLVYKGHEYYGPWFQRVDPGVHDFTYEGPDIVVSPCTAAVGPAEEFVTDTDQPLGYQEAKPGGTFVKIGVGSLRKPDDSAYDRFRLYEVVDPGKWSVRTAPDSIEFTQELLDASSGYGYVYRKTVRLAKGKAEMQIEHSLRNTGRKAIDTNVYDHNFLRIDGEAPGPDYTVTTPFQIHSDRPPNKAFAEIRGKQIVFLKTLAGQDRVTTAIQGFGDQASDYDIRVDNKKAGVGLRITADRPLRSEALWSIRAVLAVEPFIHVSAAPGQESTWTMTYDYYALSAQRAVLPDGPGKAAFEKNCTTCHDAAQAISKRRTADEWERVIDDMVTRGANGSDEELDAITAYLTKSFGKVNVNAASRQELESALGIPAEEAQAIVRYREQHGKIGSLDELQKIPGVDLSAKAKLIGFD